VGLSDKRVNRTYSKVLSEEVKDLGLPVGRWSSYAFRKPIYANRSEGDFSGRLAKNARTLKSE